jgi:heavy metal sensor kinase
VKSHFSISLRLTLWISAAFICGFVAFGGAMWLDLNHTTSQGRTKTITGRARRLAELLQSTQFEPSDRESAKFNDFAEATPEGRFIQVYDLDRNRIYPEPPAPAVDFPWPRQALDGTAGISEAPYNGRLYRVFARRIDVHPKPLLILVAGNLEDNRLLLQRFSFGLIVSTPVLLAVSALCGYFLSRRALDPVDRLTASVRSITIGNLSKRLSFSATGDELQRLAQTCNEMLARLENAVGQIARFTADASHELRSPLSLIRTLAEVALRDPRIDDSSASAFREIVTEAENAALLLDDMLTLARADAGHVEAVFEPVDLTSLLAEVCARAMPLVDVKRHTLAVDFGACKKHSICGDETSLRRLFWILLDNAIKYTPAGGRIALSLDCVNGRSRVTVTDTGIGISAAALPHIFDRFYRADASRSYEEGTGLGLAIAKWIAGIHQATLTAHSDEGLGATFQLVFPPAA